MTPGDSALFHGSLLTTYYLLLTTPGDSALAQEQEQEQEEEKEEQRSAVPEEEQPVIYSDLAFSAHDMDPRPWKLSELSISRGVPRSSAALTEVDIGKTVEISGSEVVLSKDGRTARRVVEWPNDVPHDDIDGVVARVDDGEIKLEDGRTLHNPVLPAFYPLRDFSIHLGCSLEVPEDIHLSANWYRREWQVRAHPILPHLVPSSRLRCNGMPSGRGCVSIPSPPATGPAPSEECDHPPRLDSVAESAAVQE